MKRSINQIKDGKLDQIQDRISGLEAGHHWHRLLIPATWEVELRRIMV
jgi:hypothetical protein